MKTFRMLASVVGLFLSVFTTVTPVWAEDVLEIDQNGVVTTNTAPQNMKRLLTPEEVEAWKSGRPVLVPPVFPVTVSDDWFSFYGNQFLIAGGSVSLKGGKLERGGELKIFQKRLFLWYKVIALVAMVVIGLGNLMFWCQKYSIAFGANVIALGVLLLSFIFMDDVGVVFAACFYGFLAILAIAANIINAAFVSKKWYWFFSGLFYIASLVTLAL